MYTFHVAWGLFSLSVWFLDLNSLRSGNIEIRLIVFHMLFDCVIFLMCQNESMHTKIKGTTMPWQCCISKPTEQKIDQRHWFYVCEFRKIGIFLHCLKIKCNLSQFNFVALIKIRLFSYLSNAWHSAVLFNETKASFGCVKWELIL